MLSTPGCALLCILCFAQVFASGDKLRKAAAEIEAGRLAAAEQLLGEVLLSEPNSAEGHYQLGILRFRQKRLAEARGEFLRACELAPEDAAAWKALGTVYASEGEHRLAEEPLRRACRLNPQQPDACYYFARNYYALNRFEDAVAAYQAALAHEPQPWRIHNGMALALEALARSADAERHYREAVKLAAGKAPPDQNPRIDLGVFLYKQGRTEQAAAELQQAARESAGSARLQFELGRVLFDRNMLEPSAHHLREAVRLEPNHRAAHLLLGKLYLRLGRAAEAERHLRIGRAASR